MPHDEVMAAVFQSTRPVWGATCRDNARFLVPVVSIHAPRVGRDIDARTLVLHIRVSIHAPRVGRDRKVDKPLIRPLVSIHAPRVGRD